MKLKTYSYLILALTLILLNGCESLQRSISQVSLQDLEGNWKGDYRNKENAHLEGLSATDTHNNPLPSPSVFRKRCDVTIRPLSEPFEGFTHGIFLDFGNTQAYSKKDGLVKPENLLYYLVKEEFGQVSIHSIQNSATGMINVSRLGVEVKTKFNPESQSITLRHSGLSSPVDLGVYKHIAGQHGFETNWNESSRTETTFKLKRSLNQ
ncbi:MAG: hypothetical protein MI748_13680 [Opitutales bacterium]|nr:hypothetical protein [Opitutales bacterium]